MKTKLYTTTESLPIFYPFVNRLAEISAKATMKTFDHKDGSAMMRTLRNNVIRDCKYLEILSRISEDERTEYKRDCLREEIRLNNKEASAIKRRMKKEQDENEIEKLNWRLAEIEAENDTLNYEVKKISAYLAKIQPIISDTLSPNSYDLVDIAKYAILHALQNSTNASAILKKIELANIEYEYASNSKAQNEALEKLIASIKPIIVAKREYKTKEGCDYYSLKEFSDKLIRDYVNRRRSGVASRTNFLITGYNEHGEEQYIQADRLTTDGGITDIFRANEFKEFRDRLNLTESENILARLLMEGKTEEQIGNYFGVSHQAIHKRIVKLRNRLSEYEEVQNMRRYHNNTK